MTYWGSVKTAAGAPATGTVTVQAKRLKRRLGSTWRMVKLSSTGSYSVAVRMTSAPRSWELRAMMPAAPAGLTGYTLSNRSPSP